MKCDFIGYLPSEITTINTANSQIYINIPREGSFISLLNSYIELVFDVLQTTTGNRYVDSNDIRLINLGPISLFCKYKLSTSSGKHLENIEHGHIACLNSINFKILPEDVMICLLVSIVVAIEDNDN